MSAVRFAEIKSVEGFDQRGKISGRAVAAEHEIHKRGTKTPHFLCELLE